MRVLSSFIILMLSVLLAEKTHGADGVPWPADVKGFVKPKSGEHPRLLFRKVDLPALKKKAETPEGKAILTRLRLTLNGSDGESMTREFNPDKTTGEGYEAKAPGGAFTISHMAGYGLLYQLTGDKKYAEFGKQCFEKAEEGFRDRDGRYSWKKPNGALRAGPSLGWMALGYDLCYDGWEPEFREKVGRAIAGYNEGMHEQLGRMARGLRQKPGSNHWGMQVGGTALALLAIMNDPGMDMGKLQPLIDENSRCMIRNMTEGFGDGGWFAEGDGTGSMSSHIAFLPALQAWRLAYGKDFVTPRPNAQWMALKWLFLTVPTGDRTNLRKDFPERGGYPQNIWARSGKSGGGYFSIGFGVLNEEQKAALLWFYNRHLAALDRKNKTPFDTPSPYPHHAILSFVNWPLDLREKNPGEVIPHAYRDTKFGFYAWRNRWEDENDTVISILTRPSKGNMAVKGENTLTIWSQGKKLTWGKINKGFTEEYAPAKDGSTVLSTGDGSSLAIDFSRASGADVMLVMVGPGGPTGTVIDVGGTKFSFLFLTQGKSPAPKEEGGKVVIGGQKISFDGKKT